MLDVPLLFYVLSSRGWAWLSSAHYCWQICTLVLVVLDTVLIPLTLAWPSDPTADDSPTTFYFQVRLSEDMHKVRKHIKRDGDSESA